MPSPFERAESLFRKAEKEGRYSLFEHEVYELLRAFGIEVPRFVFIPRGKKIRRVDLSAVRSPEVAVKIVHPQIIHKTDVGGVAFARSETVEVNRAIENMVSEITQHFREWRKRLSPKDRISAEEIAEGIQGVLVVEKVRAENIGFGSELLLGIRRSREFGPIVTMGLGGLDVEYVSERLKEGGATAIGSAHLLRPEDIEDLLRPLAVFDKLVGGFRGRAAPLTRAGLIDIYRRFLKMAARFSPYAKSSAYVIEEAEVNPFVLRSGTLVPLDGLCRFSRRQEAARSSLRENIEYLLRPQSIAIIGVSERMNLGHIILNNILREAFPRGRIYVVKPGLAEVEGCRGVPTVADLPETVDLLVLTLAADQSAAVMEEILAAEKARSVIIIAGGIGEKEGTQGLEESIRRGLRKNREAGKLTPVINGGNCMGIYSAPGKYDTTFIPAYKLASPGKVNPQLVYISQSGAFMASRMSKLPQAEPLYAISLGNQIDLTASDYLDYFRATGEASVYALYIEGFAPNDGLALACAAREMVAKGKTVVVYKSGRSAEGRLATAGHTASVAGDYAVCRAVLESAGVFVAETLAEFENALRVLPKLAAKEFRGRAVGLVSNAGFECVILADSLKNGDRLALARFAQGTKSRLAALLRPLGIDRLQDIRNSLDLTPVADDAAFAGCVEAILDDEGVDCAVVSPVPMTAALQTLAPAAGHAENIYGPQSLGQRLISILHRTPKPAVVNIDAGSLYDPLADMLEQAGVPVFRRSDEALRFLSKLVSVRLRAAKRRLQK